MPQHTKLLIMPQAGSFTGTSVYYHVFKGQKIFYIASPTPQNLEIYKEHTKVSVAASCHQRGPKSMDPCGVLTLCVHPSGLTCDWWKFLDEKISQIAISNPKARNQLNWGKYSLRVVTQKQDVWRRKKVLRILDPEQPSTSAASNPKKREPRKKPKNMDEEETVEIPGTSEETSTSFLFSAYFHLNKLYC